MKVIGRLPGERSCLSLVWGVLDRASRGWRGVQQTIPFIRLLAEIRCEPFGPVPVHAQEVIADIEFLTEVNPFLDLSFERLFASVTGESSSYATGSPQLGQQPPMPAARQNRLPSGHLWRPRYRVVT